MAESSSIRVGFGLGSNLGDRGQAIQSAFSFLEGCGTGLVQSSLYESDPVDCPPDSPKFLNAAAELSYTGDLLDLLEVCQNFERGKGRPEIHEKNGPRIVDIDLLYAGDRILTAARLTLPHPRLHLRGFVLQPLLEICPERIIPGLGRRVSDLWQIFLQSGEGQACRKIA